MATVTQTKLVGFGYGNKSNYSATTYANHIWFDPTNKQILLNGIEYIPKKLSELVNDSGFLNSITKAMVEGVLTGNITSHTHSYLPLSGGTLTGSLKIDYTYSESIIFKNNRIKENSGGWADNIINVKDASDTDVFNFGIYGDDISLKYAFLGVGDYYSNNLRIYSNKVAFGGNEIYHKGNFTKSTIEGLLTGTISSHTHTFASITSKPTTLGGYGITDAALASDLSKYLPLTGGTLSGNLTCNGSYINMNGDSGAKGYKGYFNQSGTSNRASGSHVFMNYGQALGSNAISLGYNAFAGIRNQDADKGTYPYIAWQWMPTEKINITINNQGTANGEFYGYEVLGGKMVQYELGGNTYTYENTSTTVRVLVCVKDDADTGLIFGGKSYMPFNVTKTLIQDKYILGRRESITNVNTITVGEVNYYVLAIYTWSPTVGYDYSTQVKVMCATKVNNSNYNGASSYASGSYSVASGNYSVASGYSSVASGYSSVASGNYSVASGYYSVASGYYSVASNEYSVASGSYSVASGQYSVASGYSSVASRSYTVTTGAKAKATHTGSFVSGYRCTSGTYFQTVIGRTNLPTADAFVIGNGSNDNVSDANAVQSNCFVVDWSGNVTAKYFSGYANAVGGEGFKIYPENTNQINFGGTGSDTTIVFGAASKDSRSVPTTYKFGADGKATLLGSADMLDGYHETKFFRHRGAANSTSISYPPTSSDLANITGIGSYTVQHSRHSSHLLNFNCEGGSTQYIQFLADYGNRLLFRCSTDSNLAQSWKQIAFTDSSITGNATTATKLQTERTLWGQSFDGTGNISGDLKFVADNQISQMSHGMRKGSIYGGFIGFSHIIGKTQPDGTISGAFTGISLGWGANPEDNDKSVRINANIFTYKSYPILHSNNFNDYALKIDGSNGNVDTASALINKLGVGSSTPTDADYYVCQYSGGGTTTTTYHRRPMSALWTYVKGKTDSLYATQSVATATTNGLMSSAMFKAKMVKSVGVRQGGTAVIEGGTITNHSVYITQDKNNLTGVYQQAVGENDVKIPNATTTYDGSMSYTDKKKLDGISNYAPKKVVALRLSFNADGNVTVISGGGDYDMTQDSELMGSKSVEQTSVNNLYLTTIKLDTTASTTDTLSNLFRNSFVKFSFMGKIDSGISNYSITVKSNFDTDTLEIQFVSTKQDDAWVVDCVWEFF